MGRREIFTENSAIGKVATFIKKAITKRRKQTELDRLKGETETKYTNEAIRGMVKKLEKSEDLLETLAQLEVAADAKADISSAIPALVGLKSRVRLNSMLSESDGSSQETRHRLEERETELLIPNEFDLIYSGGYGALAEQDHKIEEIREEIRQLPEVLKNVDSETINRILAKAGRTFPEGG